MPTKLPAWFKVTDEQMRRIRQSPAQHEVPNFILGGCMRCYAGGHECIHPKYALNPKFCPLLCF